MTTTTIGYLDEVRTDTGRAHTGAERQIGGRFAPIDESGYPIPMRAVESTVVDLSGIEIPDGCEAGVGWGDRVARGETPPVWIARVKMTPYADHPIPVGQVPESDLPDGLIDAIRDRVTAAWLADIDARPDVASVVEGYRTTVLDELDRQHEAHCRQWEQDVRAIARKFRRKWVEVGEQTVPGKCCVRSSRGKLLGYADVWDGRWRGTIDRI